MATAVIQETVIPDGVWAFDTVHSSVGYTVKHLGVATFRATFPGIAGTLETSGGEITQIDGTVEIASQVTQDETLGGHLLSPDFFDAQNHPTGRFVSTAITTNADGSLTIAGELTLRGVTQPVALSAEIEGVGPDPYGNTRLGVSATGLVDRTAFGISWNVALDNGAVAVAEKVKLVWNLEVIKQADQDRG